MENYQQILDYLFSRLPMFQRIGSAAYKANLDNTWALMEMLNHPEKKFKSIHIAGTNGKGSTSHMLASILQEAGYKTGLYTSPHLKDFRERIKVNGTMIPEAEVIHFVNKYQQNFEQIEPSFFEWTVALAFNFFAQQKVDIAIVEVGLGGRLDSTNVIVPELSLITNIGWDHMNLLGNSLPQIAEEKAGIIKPGVPVIISELQTETQPVFLNKAQHLASPIYFANQKYSVTSTSRDLNAQTIQIADTLGNSHSYTLDLTGTYQQKNILGVLNAIDLLIEKGYHISLEQLLKGIGNTIKNTGLLGRWQVLQNNPLVITDTGHNKEGIQEVLKNIKLVTYTNLHVVLGVVNDKDISTLLTLWPKEAFYYFVKPNIPRGLEAAELRDRAKLAGLSGSAYASVKEGLNAALREAGPSDLIFAGGSTFVAAEIV